MSTRHYKSLFLIIPLLFIRSTILWSDGGYIAKVPDNVWEPRQLALVMYDSTRQEETLILFTKFESHTRDFLWVVPLPSVPELKKAENDVFFDLSEWTAKTIIHSKPSSGCCYSTTLAPDDNGNREVEVFDEQQLGYFQTITVGANNSVALIDSLKAWGYFTAENSTHYQPVLDWYIAKNWVFTIVRIDTTAELEQNDSGIWYGNLQSLSFSFSSDKFIYPLKISSISTKDENMLLLFVIANHRMIFDEANTEWADRIDENEVNRLNNSYSYLSTYLGEGDFLTKLRYTFKASEMTDDLILKRASTDDEFFPSINYASFPIEWILMFSFFFWVWLRKVLVKVKNKKDNYINFNR